jgi:MipA family protein
MFSKWTDQIMSVPFIFEELLMRTPFRSHLLNKLPRLGTTAVFAFTVLLSAPGSVLANPPGQDRNGSTWGLGLGVISSLKPYKGVDREVKAIPILQYENQYIRLMGPGIEVKLPSFVMGPTQEVKFGLIAKFAFSDGYEAGDSSFLAGMAERKSGVWVGGKAEWENDLINVTAEVKRDASGDSKGSAFSVGLEKTWRFGNQFMLSPRIGATRYDKKYVDYYYGVLANEVRADRPAYLGKTAVTTEVGLRGIYVHDQNHSLMMNISSTRLPDEIKKSPLVNRSSTNSVLMGYMYRF